MPFINSICPQHNKYIFLFIVEVKVAKKTFLDIPPEKRRRPKPNFGGLIHFSPDWERAVQKYHEKSRLPETLIDGIKVNAIFIRPSKAL